MNAQEADELELFLKQRNDAFRTLDLAWAKQQVAPAEISDETALLSLHRARYECRQLEDHYRQESRLWLEMRGAERMGNVPWPLPGVLP